MTSTLRSIRWSGTLAASILATLGLLLPGLAHADTTTRLSAADNVGAALAWSTVSFELGTASTALLARDDVFADALSSGSAQGQLGAPLLLTNGDVLDPRVAVELERLGTSRVLILGGENAISGSVATGLDALGYDVERIEGPTRVETAIATAQRVLPNATHAVIARAYADGDDDPTRAFADTLASGAYASTAATPVLFTETNRLTTTLRSYLESGTIIEATVAGGTDAVSAAVVAELEDMGIEVTRASGPNRAATAVAMASDLGFTSAGASDRVVLIDGTSPDAWASGFPAAIQADGSGAPVVLSSGDTLPPETQAFLEDANGRIPLLCGPFTSAAACDAASEQMGNA